MVRRDVIEHDRQLDHDLISGRHDREVVEGEKAADVGEGVRSRIPAVPPVGRVAEIGQLRAGRVEIVDQRDAVQIVERSARVDDGAIGRVEQDGQRERVGEGNADARGGLARRVLLVDLLHRDQEVLTALLDRGRGAVGDS